MILCVLADEEAGSEHGAEFLVGEHPELFEGVRYSLGEFGGFTMEIGGVALLPDHGRREAGLLDAARRLRGPAGHASMPIRGGAMGRLGALLRALDRRRLPVHVTPVVRRR